MSDAPNHKFKNYVQKDGVIKEHENFDKRLRHREDWKDFNLYKITIDVAKEEGFTEEEYRKLVKSCCQKVNNETANDWKIIPSKTFPKTTAGEVGWRHFSNYHNLEIYGPLYKSPKLTMMPLYEPAEVIFLG